MTTKTIMECKAVEVEVVEPVKSNFKLSARSLGNLQGVHPDLIKVVKRALELTKEDFMVGEGLRTLATQQRYVRQGKSKTLNSRHLKASNGLGHAVDLYLWKNGKISWETGNPESFYEVSHSKEYKFYQEIGRAMKVASEELNIPIRWGADWDGDGQHTDHSFIDWVHFELPVKDYPA